MHCVSALYFKINADLLLITCFTKVEAVSTQMINKLTFDYIIIQGLIKSVSAKMNKHLYCARVGFNYNQAIHNPLT